MFRLKSRSLAVSTVMTVGACVVCGLTTGCIFGPPPDDMYPPPMHASNSVDPSQRPWPNMHPGQGFGPTTQPHTELVNIDLSSPKATALTYYRAMSYGDAYAARAAVLGDDLTTRYIDSSTAFSAAVRDLYSALSEHFGRDAARSNPEFLGYVESFSSPDVSRSIATGEVRITGDTATLTLRPSGVYPGNEEAPAVFKRLFGQWRLAMLASRRLDGIQAEEAIEASITNRRSAVRFAILARGVRGGQYRNIAQLWGADEITTPTAVAVAPHPAIAPAEPPTVSIRGGGIWPGTLPAEHVALVNPNLTHSTIPAPVPADIPAPTPSTSRSAIVDAGPGSPQAAISPAPPVVAIVPPEPLPAPPVRPVIPVEPPPVAPEVAHVPVAPTPIAPPSVTPAPPIVTPEPAVAMQPGATAIRQAHLEIVKSKLDKGAGVNDKDLRGRTMLHDASIAGEDEIVKLLITKGANVKAVDGQGWTSLHWAASSGHAAVVRQLLDAGADINAKDQIGATPLHWAAIFDQKETAELLIDRGADLKARDNQGKTPLHSAAEHDAQQVATVLLAKGANLKAKDEEGATPLHAVIQHARAALADLEITVSDTAGGTSPIPASATSPPADLKDARENIVHHAADMISLLIASGADVNVHTPRGLTPLHLAAWDDTRELAALLISKGAEVDAQDAKGRTPLEMGRQRGQKEIIQLLTAKADQ